MKTNDEILDQFLYFEYNHDMFNTLHENNVKSWHYIRFWVYMELIEAIFGKVNLNNMKSTVKFKSSIWERIDNVTRRSPLLVNKRDLLVFNHSRRIKYNNFYKCIYTDEWLKNCKIPYYVFEEEFNGTHLKPVITKNLKYFDVDKYGNMLAIKKREHDINTKKIKRILQDLETEFNITLSNKAKRNICNIYVNQLMYRDYYLNCYYHLLKKIEPKILVITVAYNYQHMLMIEVAKSLNIKTVELEHGFISNGHIAYNFYEKVNLQSFPDYIFTFGEFDRDIPRYPFERKYAIPVGSVENELRANYYKQKLANKKRKKKIITYLSDGTYELIRNAYEVANSKFCDYEVRLKLHPSEYKKWEKLYPFLINGNVLVCDDTKHNIYYYLATSDYVIGSATTTVYEATLFDTNILVLASGEYFRSLHMVNNGDAILVKNSEEVLEILNNNVVINKNREENIYFTNDSCKKIIENLNYLIG